MPPATLYELTRADRAALVAALCAIPGVNRAAAQALAHYSHVAAAALAAYHAAVAARNAQRLTVSCSAGADRAEEHQT